MQSSHIVADTLCKAFIFLFDNPVLARFWLILTKFGDPRVQQVLS